MEKLPAEFWDNLSRTIEITTEQRTHPARHQPRIFLREVVARFIVLPISSRACVRALGLPATYPKDPADRIIGATALVERLSLLTVDRAIQRSRALHTIW
jgi:PIN domain nuclease of toxin-antitoxin system